MIIYIVLLVFLLIVGFFNRSIQNNKNKKHLLRLSCIVLFVVAAIRNKSVGADTLQYTQIFNWAKNLQFNELNQASGSWWNSDTVEYSYKVYNKIISLFFDFEQAITIFNSFFIMLGVYLMIKNNSKDYWLSLFLFYALGFYQLSLNLTPSFIGALFVLSGWKYLNKHEWYKFALYSLFALIFHTSVFAVIIVCVLSKILKLNFKSFMIIILLSFIIIVFGYNYMNDAILYIIPSKYQYYLISDDIMIEQLLVLCVHIIIFVGSIMLCFYRTGNKNVFVDKKAYIWVFIFEFIFYCFTLKNTIFSRAAFLVSPFICIIIPELFEYSKENNIRFEDNYDFMSRPVINNMSSFIVLIICFQYLVRLFINNIGTTMPYSFFWG